MRIQKIEKGNIAVFAPGTEIRDMWQMMDRMVEALTADCFGLIVHSADLPEGFFDLSSGIAGEILQKFSNYRMMVGIVGDFTAVQSYALKCFIAECSRGRSVFFHASEADCIGAMAAAY